MKVREYNQGDRRVATVQAGPVPRGDQAKPQVLTAPGMMTENDTWKRYANSRLKQFSTR